MAKYCDVECDGGIKAVNVYILPCHMHKLGMCVYHWVMSHEVEVKHNEVWIIPTNWVTVSARLLSNVFY